MIMPNKYIREDEALIGIGGILLKKLSSEKSLSELWDSSKKLSNIGTYERFILALDMLFILNLICLQDNKIMRINNDLQNLRQ
jgi:hypothetical protein